MKRYWVTSEYSLWDEGRIGGFDIMDRKISIEVRLWKDVKQEIERLQDRIRQLEEGTEGIDQLYTDEGDW